MIRRIHVPTFLRRFRTRNWVGRKVFVSRPRVWQEKFEGQIMTIQRLQWTGMGLVFWLDGYSPFTADELDWWGE
jgi:hypothetical protein